MPKYTLVAEVTVSVSTEVEADTLEAALLAACEHPMQSFCNQCDRGLDDEWGLGGELDGTPRIVEAHVDDELVAEDVLQRALKATKTG